MEEIMERECNKLIVCLCGRLLMMLAIVLRFLLMHNFQDSLIHSFSMKTYITSLVPFASPFVSFMY